ncbi:MAG TPA: MFS transporter [Verrucomicrobiae bacterium]|nr:MFS transporter [Verrucomicrobiae bacterium]
MSSPLSPRARYAVLSVAFAALLFDGMELGLMPIAAGSVAQSFLGDAFTKELGGIWFARLNASLLLGAAFGGIWMGSLGDKIGRTRALGIGVLFYSIFCGLGYFVTSLNQMLVLRFFVGLGVGGVWPNGVALVSECWPKVSRPIVAGIMGAGLNFGIFLLSRLTAYFHITPESWRWIFAICGAPALLGIIILVAVPESPTWLASRSRRREEAVQIKKPATPLAELFRPPLLRTILIGIALGSIPLVGAWAASKWIFPWAELIAGKDNPDYKSTAQAWWSVGAILGSFFGAQLASLIGRRLAYFLISLGSSAITCGLFLFTKPMQPIFLPLLFAQGFIATLFFGWLPLYLPELFPTRVRATGSGIAYNVGRFATAIGLFAAGMLVGFFGGDYSRVGAVMALIYALGMIVIWFAPDTTNKSLEE